ncbi:MAG TPA: DUF3147 family protein [Candidatus Poseidoniales archaeon]|nr:MAG TPA: DUF3147 family protein [Candidatus Poseidoniales archaeon]|tara:strand:- start:106 stop:462 length:357 start_codon:yes stop_codon:yes gene_type:complete
MSVAQLIGKGLLSGSIVVAASELAKKSAVFGALVVSLPMTSILAMTALYHDTRDASQVADFAESILWLVVPSLTLFIVLPIMIRRGWGFEVSLVVGIIATIAAYALGVWSAQMVGGLD